MLGDLKIACAKLHDEGLTVRQIAAKVGRKGNTVWSMLNRQGIRPRVDYPRMGQSRRSRRRYSS